MQILCARVKKKNNIIPKGDGIETCFYNYCLLGEKEIIKTDIVSIT